MGCVFCALNDSGDAQWVAQRPGAVAFLPLPESVLAPDDATLAATSHLLREVGNAMVAALGATGVVVLNASGAHSGQSVPHLHFHVVPRWPDDAATLWPADRSTHVVAGDVRQRLADAL